MHYLFQKTKKSKKQDSPQYKKESKTYKKLIKWQKNPIEKLEADH